MSAQSDPQATMFGFAQTQGLVTCGTCIGSWRIERSLGAGAMGEVYLARRGDEQAALKLVARRIASDEAFIQRFQREIAVLSKLDHPHVARALDWGAHDGRPWLAMEYVDGPDVERLLGKHGPFFEADVLKLAVQIARGLEHIHLRAGLIHRDIKPANVLIARAHGGEPTRLLNPGDAAKLIDFGLAKPVEQNEDHGLTMTGMIMGTPNYIAPEQVACERHLTLHVDMYALGAAMFHLLTGRVPFEAGSAAAVMAAHLNQPAPDPGQLVPALTQPTRRIVLTSMEKKASARFTDWNAFVVACERALTAMGEGQIGTGRILKKPMVKAATTTSVVRRDQAAARPAPQPGSEPHVVPTRSIHAGGALEVRPGTAAAVAESVRPKDGSAALRAAVTAKVARVQTSAKHRRDGGGAVAATASRGPQTSAVHKWSGRLETTGTTGGAILPWVVLAFAVLAAAAGVVWALMR